MRSISKTSYLDVPTVNSIASVYQSRRLKDAMQFHHAAFNNCAKSTLLTAASKCILPLWPLFTRANISKNLTKTQATHMGHTQIIRQNLRSTRKEVPLYLQNLETEGINIKQEKKCSEVYLIHLHWPNGSVSGDLSKGKQTAVHCVQLWRECYPVGTNEEQKRQWNVKGIQNGVWKTVEERNKTKIPNHG